jgi:hypothetical protein
LKTHVPQEWDFHNIVLQNQSSGKVTEKNYQWQDWGQTDV